MISNRIYAKRYDPNEELQRWYISVPYQYGPNMRVR